MLLYIGTALQKSRHDHEEQPPAHGLYRAANCSTSAPVHEAVKLAIALLAAYMPLDYILDSVWWLHWDRT
jgi:hypothetical protein